MNSIPGVTLEQLSETGIGKSGLWNTDQKRQAYILSVGSTQTLVIWPMGPLTNSGNVYRKKLNLSKHSGNIYPYKFCLNNSNTTGEARKLTDCSSPHDSSEYTASVCLPQTLEASGRQHTLRWRYSEPAASGWKANSQEHILLILHTYKNTLHIKKKCKT